MVNFGILGPGNIADKFADDLKRVEGAKLVAVGSRSLDRARNFAARHSAPKSFGSYEALVSDPSVDVVYVATPHSFHREHTLLCLQAKKAVLCEKPIATSFADSLIMVKEATNRGLFFMEAHWTSFLPTIRRVFEELDSGAIGDIQLLQADFGFRAAYDLTNRLFDPLLGGGALLDVGVYPILLATLVFGADPHVLLGTATKGETSVDEQTSITLRYKQGQIASLNCSIRANTPNDAFVCGTEGYCHIPMFWCADKALIHRGEKGMDIICEPKTGYGYYHEIEEVVRCINAGKTQSSTFTLQHSLDIMRIVEDTKRQITANGV